MLCSSRIKTPSSLTSTLAGVLVGAAPDLVGLALALGDDLLRLDIRGARQLALLDQECGLLLGTCQDALRLLLGALDDALRFVVDALRLAHLLGHGNAQLIEQVERTRLVDDHVARQRHGAAARDQPFELFDQKDDVDESRLRARAGRSVHPLGASAVNGRLYGLSLV